jgi:hypothetical protein
MKKCLEVQLHITSGEDPLVSQRAPLAEKEIVEKRDRIPFS